MLQAGKQRAVVCFVCRWLIKHDDVHSVQLLPVVPEGLTHEPLQPVSTHRRAAVFFGNGKAEPGAAVPILAVQNREQLVLASPGLLEYVVVGIGVRQAAGSFEPAVFGRVSSGLVVCRSRGADLEGYAVSLWTKLGAALRTSPLEDQASGLGRHPRSKPVGASTLEFAGLEGAFHSLKPALKFCGVRSVRRCAGTRAKEGGKGTREVLCCQ